MRLVCISDIHGKTDFELPEGDLLIIAGDLTMKGTAAQIKEVGVWMDQVAPRFSHGIVYIAGNHDFLFEHEPFLAKNLANPRNRDDIRYLQQSSIMVHGVSFWGAADTPEFYNWAFNRTDEELEEIWAKIPADDVVITHGPPHKILDKTPRNMEVGSKSLKAKILSMRPGTLHVFGHIHCANGTKYRDNRLFVNASICDESYEPVQDPIVLEQSLVYGKSYWEVIQ